MYIVDQLQDAVKTLVTQLRIDPNNEVAKMNRAYFQRLKGISRKDYVERKVRVHAHAYCSMIYDISFE